MLPMNEGKHVVDIGLATTNATARHRMSFDTLNQDALNVYVACGSHDSATQGITEIIVSDDDTVTSASSQTGIAALSSATETSTSFSNVLPTAAVMALGGIVTEFQIDLKERKRYVGIDVETTAVAAGMPVSTMARMTRSAESKDSATQKAGIDLAATNVSGCMAVVRG